MIFKRDVNPLNCERNIFMLAEFNRIDIVDWRSIIDIDIVDRTSLFYVYYNVGPLSYKLVYKPHEYYSYKYHKP